MADIFGVVEEEAVVASAPEESGAPNLTEQANGDFACFCCDVVDGSGRVATAASVVGVVGLVYCAHVDTCTIGEVVDLVWKAMTH